MEAIDVPGQSLGSKFTAQEQLFIGWFQLHPEHRDALLHHCGGCGAPIDEAINDSSPSTSFPHRILIESDPEKEKPPNVLVASAVCVPCRDRAHAEPEYSAALNRRICEKAGVPWNNFDVIREGAYEATPEDKLLLKLRDIVVETAKEQPWVVEGIQRCARLDEAGLPWVLHTASDVFAEVHMNAVALLTPAQQVLGGTGKPLGILERIMLAEFMQEATPVLWELEMLEEARALEMPGPAPWHCDDVDPPLQFWTWPKELRYSDTELIQAVLLADSEVLRAFHLKMHGQLKKAGNPGADRVGYWPPERWTEVVVIAKDTAKDAMIAHRYQFLDGTIYPDAFNWHPDAAYTRDRGAFYSMLGFINSPFVIERATEEVSPPRSMRREAARKHGTTTFPKARFLTLRRIRLEAGHKDEEGTIGGATATARQYTRSWVVSQHWRRVHYGPKRGQVRWRLFPRTVALPHLPFVPRAERVKR